MVLSIVIKREETYVPFRFLDCLALSLRVSLLLVWFGLVAGVSLQFVLFHKGDTITMVLAQSVCFYTILPESDYDLECEVERKLIKNLIKGFDDF